MVLKQFGEVVNIPSASSKTIQFNREEKFSTSTTPTQLTEGIAPDAVGITINQFQAVAEQYGFLVRLTDLAELTAKHPIVARTMTLMGIQAQETYDQLIFNVLAANTNVYRPNARVSNATVTATDTIGYKDLVNLTAGLDDNGARPMGGSSFVLVLAPQAYASLQLDPTWISSHQYKFPEAIFKGEVGTLANMRIVKSNAPSMAYTSQATSGAANKLYTGFAIGEMAYQVSNLQNLEAYVVAPGGQSDPLQQNRKMGWKFAFKALITNPSWITTIISAGGNSVNNA